MYGYETTSQRTEFVGKDTDINLVDLTFTNEYFQTVGFAHRLWISTTNK